MNHLAWGRKCFSRVSSKENLKETCDAPFQLQRPQHWGPDLHSLLNPCTAWELLLCHLCFLAERLNSWEDKSHFCQRYPVAWHPPYCTVPGGEVTMHGGYCHLHANADLPPWYAGVLWHNLSDTTHMLVDLRSLQKVRKGHYKLVGLWCSADQSCIWKAAMPQLCQSALILIQLLSLLSHMRPCVCRTFTHILVFAFAWQRDKRHLGKHSLHLCRKFYHHFLLNSQNTLNSMYIRNYSGRPYNHSPNVKWD